MLGFIIRTSRHFRNLDTILLLYESLVRCHLEYATQIWNPHTYTNLEIIEKLQRRFTRYVYRKFHIPYQDYDQRLRLLQLQPLWVRRIYFDLIFLYKIANGLVHTSSISGLVMRINNKNIRNMNLFAVKTYDVEAARNSPIPRMMKQYNDMFRSENCLNLPISEYKKKVKSNLKNIWQ